MEKLFVGNIQPGVTHEQLRAIFEPYGPVASAVVITDRQTGRARGFGFVEMPEKGDAEGAIAALNGKPSPDGLLTVNHARPAAERGSLRGNGRMKMRGPSLRKRTW
jgi:RNA recognition motif-containing protein